MSEDVTSEELELEPSPNEEVDEVEEGAEEQEHEFKLDRPAKNFIAELTRKNNEQMSHFQEQMFAKMADMLKDGTKSSEPVEQKTGLYAYTVDQLEQHAATLEDTDPMRQQIRDHVAERKIDAKVDAKVGAITAEQKMMMARDDWARKARAKFPELEDETSDFYKKVEAELRTMDSKVVAVDPRAAYNAATAVAVAEGVKPAARRVVPAKPGATKAGAKPADTPADSGPSDADIDKVGASLQHALPKGKTFNKDNIRERSKIYSTNLRHHLKG